MKNRADASLWADTPFALLKIPGQPSGPVCANPSVLSVAIEMANVHNALLRPLNVIYHQAPFIRLPTDIADLMLVEEIAKEAGIYGWEGLMGGNVEQHHEFEPKAARLVKWAKEVMAGENTYDAAELKRQIDGFAPVLTQHLHDEIDTLIKLENCDGEKVKQAMKKTADEGAKTADPNLVIPLVLGSIDRGYPGSKSFPPIPFFILPERVLLYAQTQRVLEVQPK